jgi:hypothetical protein
MELLVSGARDYGDKEKKTTEEEMEKVAIESK